MQHKISSRNDAAAIYPDLLPGGTVYEYNGKLWTGQPFMVGHQRGIQLTPLTAEQEAYLRQRNTLPKIR